MHQQLWGYKVEWKSVSRGTGGKRLNTTGLGDRNSIPGWGNGRIFFFATESRPALGPAGLLSNGYWGLLPRGLIGRVVKPNTRFHLLPRLRIHAALPPFSVCWTHLNLLQQLVLGQFVLAGDVDSMALQ
jgi:hypothetical protein